MCLSCTITQIAAVSMKFTECNRLKTLRKLSKQFNLRGFLPPLFHCQPFFGLPKYQSSVQCRAVTISVVRGGFFFWFGGGEDNQFENSGGFFFACCRKTSSILNIVRFYTEFLFYYINFNSVLLQC